jgi:ribosome silencing factor RsfS/YbeB/iojap
VTAALNPVDADTRELAVCAARAADDKQGHDIIVIDVGDVLPITSLFVVASASNSRLVRTIADEVTERVRNATGRSPVRSEGMAEAQWILVYYGDMTYYDVKLDGVSPLVRLAMRNVPGRPVLDIGARARVAWSPDALVLFR